MRMLLWTHAKRLAAILLCSVLPLTAAEVSQASYEVTYAGGSLPDAKSGEDLKILFDQNAIQLLRKKQQILSVPVHSITQISYSQEMKHRIGTGAGLAVVSLGVGAIVAFSKTKKHFIGLEWADSGANGGIVIQADKNDFRGLIAGLEGLTGRHVVDADTKGPANIEPDLYKDWPKTSVSTAPAAAPATQQPAATPARIQIESTPPGAEVLIVHQALWNHPGDCHSRAWGAVRPDPPRGIQKLVARDAG
jgi:hypothetical protein